MSKDIINPHTGKAAMPSMTAVKKDHDPEEATRELNRLQQVFMQLGNACWTELNPDADKPKVIDLDEEKVIDHYSTKWKEQADILNRSGFPHKVEPLQLETYIREQLRARNLQAAAQRPMHLVQDLFEYKLWEYRDLPIGKLCLNSHVAVAITEQGLVTLWLRGANETIQEWAEDWATEDAYQYRMPQVQQANYTIAELTMLLGAARVKNPHRLPQGLLVARKPYTSSTWFDRLIGRA